MNDAPLYTLHERIWHWIQALTIGVLLVTGAEIHAPGRFHPLGFETAVAVHNTFAALLLLNAVLGLFYFLTSGMLRQYLPGERGFFHLALAQARYYLRGIFRGETHPMEPTPERKLNPLQKLTYLAILNVLLPLQVLTGVLIWGAQRWPGFVDGLGGLSVLVPVHALASWLFLAFILMHVYLTTTGRTPLASLRAMLGGYSAEPEKGAES